MKIGITLGLILLVLTTSYGQTEVSWSFSFNPENNQLEAKASIGDGWHLYSTERASEIGPVPTSFEFQSAEGYELVGNIKEPKPKVAYDANFGETMYYFEDEVVFTQGVEVKDAESINGTVTYMVCNDEMCMPPVDVEFTIELIDEN